MLLKIAELSSTYRKTAKENIFGEIQGIHELDNFIYKLNVSIETLTPAVKLLVEKPITYKHGHPIDIMHYIPLLVNKLDVEKQKELFKACKTSVDASVERLINPILRSEERRVGKECRI